MSGGIEVERKHEDGQVVTWSLDYWTWRTTNYRERTITSERFKTSTRSDSDTEWTLTLKMEAKSYNTEHATAELRAVDGAALPLRARVRVTLQYSDHKFGEQRGSGATDEVTFVKDGAVTLDLGRQQSLPSGPCVLRCEINVASFDWCSFVSGHLLSSDLTDVIIETKNSELPAHKFILSARSSVFRAMFSHSFREASEGRVALTEYDGALVEELLRFLYTGRVQDPATCAVELMALADMYDLEELKQMCFAELHPKISPSNVVAVLILADSCNFTTKKAEAVEYIKKNFLMLSRTRQWRELKKHPDLVTELMFAGCPQEDSD